MDTTSARYIQAKDLINNTLFRDMVKELSERYYTDWVASGTVEEREEIHAKQLVLQDVVDEMNGIIAMYTGDGNA